MKMKKHDLFARQQLATYVFALVEDEFESLECEDKLGPDLAYLMAAILKGTACAWREDRAIVRLLRKHCDQGHPAWDHVEIEPAIDDAAVAAYVAAGGVACPACGSDDLRVASTPRTNDLGAVNRQMCCEDCGATWRDVYRLTTIADFKGARCRA